MIDKQRQVPAISALAWSIDMTIIGGPVYVVLSRDEVEARAALARHLVEIGSISNTMRAERIVATAAITSVGVVW